MVSYGSNYPDGVTGGEDYFYPPTCPTCGAFLDEWNECPDCRMHECIYDSRRDLEVDKALEAMDGR